MTPFERYLYEKGLFDVVIRPEITADDVVLEPVDLCIDVGCEEYISYWKRECHKNPKVAEVPYNHCYKGCVDCPEIVRQGVVVSHCACVHHRFLQ